jgi:hypothetical protein
LQFAEKLGLRAMLLPQRLKPVLKHAFIAAVNRCATQKQEKNRVLPATWLAAQNAISIQ